MPDWKPFLRWVIEPISRNGFWYKIKAAVRNKPEEYTKYFEDLFRAPNTEFGPKAFFEMGSTR